MPRRPKPSLPQCSEDDIQRAGLEYLAAVVPNECFAFAVPNAAFRTKTGKAANGVPGLTPGVFDTCLLLPCGRVAFIEFKRPGETLSKPQEAFQAVLDRFGTPYAIATSIDDIRVALAAWGIKTREVWDDTKTT